MLRSARQSVMPPGANDLLDRRSLLSACDWWNITANAWPQNSGEQHLVGAVDGGAPMAVDEPLVGRHSGRRRVVAEVVVRDAYSAVARLRPGRSVVSRPHDLGVVARSVPPRTLEQVEDVDERAAREHDKKACATGR